ncbi:MAG: hypothetical protein RI988_654 [Pseudomonadota bacterium]|jgi:iron complex outermembrane receptor protein
MRPGAAAAATAAAAWALALLAPGVALAQQTQQAQPEPAAPAERLVITASGAERRILDTPYAVGTVDAEALRAAGPMVNLSEALSRVPGVVASNRHNYAQDLQINSRGFGARASFGVRGIRLLTDGIPASGPDGQGQVSHFDLAGAQRIEVLRGPFSALYGSSSGGVISLVSAAPRERLLELGADVGSFGLAQARLRVEAPLEGGFDIRAQASRFDIDGFRPQSAASRTLGNLRLGWTGAQDRVTVLVSSIDQPAQDPLGLTRQQFDQDPGQTATQALPQAAPGQADRFDTRKTVRQDQAGLQWRHRFEGLGPLQEGRLAAYQGRRAVTQWQAIPVATQFNAANPVLTERHPGGVIDFDRRYEGLDARLSWGWLLGGEREARVVLGAATDRSEEDRRGYENFNGTGATQLLGVTGRLRRDERNRVRADDRYAQAEVDLAARWALQFGVRQSRVAFDSRDRYVSGANGDDSGSLQFRATNPVAALQWRAGDTWRLHLGVGRGFEVPTFAELAYRPDGLPGVNTALRAQTSRQWELGAKWRPAGTGLAVDLAVFEARTRDEIGVATNRGGRSTFRNVGRTTRSGAELDARWAIARDWRAQLALTVLDARYVDAFTVCRTVPCTTPDLPVPAGNRIAGTLPATAFAEVAWRLSPRVELAAEVRGQGRQPVNDVNADFAAGHALVGLRATARHPIGTGRLEALVRLDNVFDRRVAGSVIVNESNGRFFEPAPGRNALLALRWVQGF